MKTWKIREIKKPDLPEGLRKIKNCPEKLYYRGDWDEGLFEKSLAIVGSRKMSRYGREAVARFMPQLVAGGVTVISGFMYGVDSEAHRQCIELSGRTVAVLGWGLDYQAIDKKLYEKILQNKGLIISEYEADFVPTLWSFPQRNRIVAGLASLGVLVVQAGEKSGSLITARLAEEQNKKVWAIPGQIDSSVAEGVNWLLKTGKAKIATEAGDILGGEKTTRQESLFEVNLDELEKRMIEKLKREPMEVDELARELEVKTAVILTKISTLSIKNVVEEENGKVYLIK